MLEEKIFISLGITLKIYNSIVEDVEKKYICGL